MKSSVELPDYDDKMKYPWTDQTREGFQSGSDSLTDICELQDFHHKFYAAENKCRSQVTIVNVWVFVIQYLSAALKPLNR
jgi:hypothetical protein